MIDYYGTSINKKIDRVSNLFNKIGVTPNV